MREWISVGMAGVMMLVAVGAVVFDAGGFKQDTRAGVSSMREADARLVEDVHDIREDLSSLRDEVHGVALKVAGIDAKLDSSGLFGTGYQAQHIE